MPSSDNLIIRRSLWLRRTEFRPPDDPGITGQEDRENGTLGARCGPRPESDVSIVSFRNSLLDPETQTGLASIGTLKPEPDHCPSGRMEMPPAWTRASEKGEADGQAKKGACWSRSLKGRDVLSGGSLLSRFSRCVFLNRFVPGFGREFLLHLCGEGSTSTL